MRTRGTGAQCRGRAQKTERSPQLPPHRSLGNCRRVNEKGPQEQQEGALLLGSSVSQIIYKAAETWCEAECPQGAGAGPKKPYTFPALVGFSGGSSKPSRRV